MVLFVTLQYAVIISSTFKGTLGYITEQLSDLSSIICDVSTHNYTGWCCVMVRGLNRSLLIRICGLGWYVFVTQSE